MKEPEAAKYQPQLKTIPTSTMWEVVWTDPHKESVKEHRERKAQKEKQRAHRASGSTRTSASSESRSFGLFNSKTLKKTSPAKAKSSTSLLQGIQSHDSKSRRASYLSAAASNTMPSNPQVEPLVQPSPGTELERDPGVYASSGLNAGPADDVPQDSGQSSVRDSVVTKWTQNSAQPTQTSPCNTSFSESLPKTSAHCIQTLGPSSFITKDTEITVTIRESDHDMFNAGSEVKISARPTSEVTSEPSLCRDTTAHSTVFNESPIDLFPGCDSLPPSSRNSLNRVPSWSSSFKPNNPDCWKPPDAWDCVPSSDHRTSAFEDIIEEPVMTANDAPNPLDLNAMQRDIRRMAAASCRVRLIRLKESWGVSDNGSLYRELEMERQRWLLSSVDFLNKQTDANTNNVKRAPLRIAAAKSRKILALYETQATASYLAGIHGHKKVYHMSPSPLSHASFPNIHPVLVPTISSAVFPVAQGLFGAAHSLNLSSQVSSPDMTNVLKNIHRCLTPGGIFHLTLIDPLPQAMALGPVLRAWLEEHLIFNIERNFRCMNPSKLFPIWLGDAALRGDGSSLTTVNFLAVQPSDGQGRSKNMSMEKAARQELRSVVGRMLWKEVWGQLIEADNWWWEVPEIVDECVQMGTTWNYFLIEAVKD